MKLVHLTLAGALAASPAGTHLRSFNREEYVENSIITSLSNCPMCAGHEPCLMDCRKVQQKPWAQCLNICLKDNPMVADTLFSLVKSQERPLQGFGN